MLLIIHIWKKHKQRSCSCQNEKNCREIAKGRFSKITKLLTERALWKKLFRTCNSNSFNFNDGLCNHSTGFCLWHTPSLGGKQFLWLLKNDFCNFTAFSPSFEASKPLFFQICLIRSIIAYLCPNVKFDTVDFSHSEDVMFLLMLSVVLFFFCVCLCSVF